MPIYIYECGACGEQFEILERFATKPPDGCAECGKGPVRRIPTVPGSFRFVGPGFHAVDYKTTEGKGR